MKIGDRIRVIKEIPDEDWGIGDYNGPAPIGSEGVILDVQDLESDPDKADTTIKVGDAMWRVNRTHDIAEIV